MFGGRYRRNKKESLTRSIAPSKSFRKDMPQSGARPEKTAKILKILENFKKFEENEMKKAIKIEDLPSGLDETAVQVLRIIALKLGERQRGRVEYMHIAQSLNMSRAAVAKAVKRLAKSRAIKFLRTGEMEILNAVNVEG